MSFSKSSTWGMFLMLLKSKHRVKVCAERGKFSVREWYPSAALRLVGVSTGSSTRRKRRVYHSPNLGALHAEFAIDYARISTSHGRAP